MCRGRAGPRGVSNTNRSLGEKSAAGRVGGVDFNPPPKESYFGCWAKVLGVPFMEF